MKQGDYIRTPRFCTVRIAEVFDSKKSAMAAGYTEPTHYEGDYEIFGKHTGINRMTFAAAYVPEARKKSGIKGEVLK